MIIASVKVFKNEETFERVHASILVHIHVILRNIDLFSRVSFLFSSFFDSFSHRMMLKKVRLIYLLIIFAILGYLYFPISKNFNR